MGRKTFDSIGRPLPNRKNIVLSNNLNLKIDGVEVFNSPDEVISLYKEIPEKKDMYIIGGTFVYKLFLEYCDYLYITYVDKNFEGDAFFPKIDWKAWNLTREEEKYDENEKLKYFFRDYKRI
jgi:dihydrofolate reductase